MGYRKLHLVDVIFRVRNADAGQSELCIFINRTGRPDGINRSFRHIDNGDVQGLGCIKYRRTVISCNYGNIVTRFGFVIGARLESEGSGAGVKIEISGIGAGHRVGKRLAVIRVRGGCRIDNCARRAVFRDAGGADRGNDRGFVDVVDVYGNAFAGGQIRKSGFRSNHRNAIARFCFIIGTVNEVNGSGAIHGEVGGIRTGETVHQRLVFSIGGGHLVDESAGGYIFIYTGANRRSDNRRIVDSGSYGNGDRLMRDVAAVSHGDVVGGGSVGGQGVEIRIVPGPTPGAV